MGIAIYLGTTLAALLLGGQALRIFRLWPEERTLRLLAAFVVGHGILGLLILGLGLLGYANWWAMAELMLLAAWAGLRSIDVVVGGGIDFVRRGWRALRSSPYAPAYRVIALVAVLQLVAALAPAGPTDYDGIAEHLAQAQQYVMAGRIVPLWYDHHSHFPATLQMYYMLAHALNVPGAAKLYHWGFGVVALLATLLLGRRLLGPAAGAYGALILATTPIFAWLMGVGYVDLATIAASIVALLLFCLWLRDRDPQLLWLSALTVGVAAGTKMQAIALMGVLMVGVAIAVPGWQRRLRTAGVFLAIAVAICLPWYLKSWVWTGNPVYPFAHSVFGGKMWSADRAEGYRSSQLEFGKGEMPPGEELAEMSPLRRIFVGPRAPMKLLLAPLNLLTDPEEFTVGSRGFGAFAFASAGPVYLALLIPMLLLKRPRPVGWIMMVFAPLWVWWLVSMQLSRYLLPSLALIAPAVGWAAAEAERQGGALRAASKVVMGVWPVLALGMMIIYVAPQVRPVLGLQSPQEYLVRSLDVYPTTHYLAQHAPEDAVVALYGEPRGYYLERRHIWGERGHSALLDYDSVEGPEDLMAEFRRLGITHVVARTPYFPELWGSGDPVADAMGAAVDAGLMGVLWAAPGRDKGYVVLKVVEPPG